MLTEEMTLIKYYYNPYHISSRIKENKITFHQGLKKTKLIL